MQDEAILNDNSGICDGRDASTQRGEFSYFW